MPLRPFAHGFAAARPMNAGHVGSYTFLGTVL
jgi:hypothetical protein